MADTDDSREKQRAYYRAWKTANRERLNAKNRAIYAENREAEQAKSRKWNAENADRRHAIAERRANKLRAEKPPKYAYIKQKSQAKQRGIPFLLTFEEWWKIWLDSGKWKQRGIRLDQCCMARFGDIGPYAVGNVRICSVSENHSEGARGRKHTDAARKAISVAVTARYARACHTSGAPPPSSLTGDDLVQTDHQQAPQSASE